MTALGAQHKNNYVMPPCARNGKHWSGGALSLLSLVLSLMSLTHRRKKGQPM